MTPVAMFKLFDTTEVIKHIQENSSIMLYGMHVLRSTIIDMTNHMYATPLLCSALPRIVLSCKQQHDLNLSK